MKCSVCPSDVPVGTVPGLPLTPGKPLPRSRPAPAGLVLAAFAAVYLIWGSTYLGITIAVQHIPPFLMAGTRFILAGGGLYWVMRSMGAAAPSAIQWRSAILVGALLIFAGNGGVCWAQGRVPSGISALMVASVPLWILLLDWLRRGGTRPSGVVWVGLLLGAGGVAMIVFSKAGPGGKSLDPAGVSVLLLAAFCWALGSVYSRYAAKPDSSLLTVAMQMLSGGVLQLGMGLLLGETRGFDPTAISAASWGAFWYLTLIGSLVGYTAYVWLLQVSTPARVSTYAYVNPFVAVILGHWILNEVLAPATAAAGAMILLSVILITRRQGSNRLAREAVPKQG